MKQEEEVQVENGRGLDILAEFGEDVSELQAKDLLQTRNHEAIKAVGTEYSPVPQEDVDEGLSDVDEMLHHVVRALEASSLDPNYTQGIKAVMGHLRDALRVSQFNPIVWSFMNNVIAVFVLGPNAQFAAIKTLYKLAERVRAEGGCDCPTCMALREKLGIK